ncbi:hypothetical protein [uncultured Bacteroides sp.]|uniref:hypothetical protein n=1 Tax=uncultured Bacteroides sp. TaxID=162156 RepID=UPI00338E60F2
MYHSGIWDKERAINEIRVYKTYDQIAFITQRAIDQLLRMYCRLILSWAGNKRMSVITMQRKQMLL